MEDFTIGSYNCKNFKGPLRVPFISELFAKCDFLLLQEHWLLESQFHLFNDLLTDGSLSYHGKSSMNPDIHRCGRPFGGNVILWRSNLKFKVLPITTVSSRLSCVQIFLTETSFILLFNVYMPCDEGRHGVNYCEFQDILSEVSVICTQLKALYICFGGDFNTDFSRTRSPQTKELLQFCEMEQLIATCSIQQSSIQYTYECNATCSRSLIDHVLFSHNLKDLVIECYTYDNIKNGSDHVAVITNFKLCIDYFKQSYVDRTPRVAWYKAQISDIEKYKKQLDVELDKIIIPRDVCDCRNVNCYTHASEIETFYSGIVNACVNASQVLPQTGNNSQHSKKQPVPGWNDICKEKRSTALFWHSLWKSAGKPQSGQLALIRRHTRAVYHRAVKAVQRNKEKLRSEQMAKSIQGNKSRNFWKEVKSFRGKHSQKPITVDGASGDGSIAGVFADKFKQVFNCVGYDSKDLSITKNSIDRCTKNMSQSHVEKSLVTLIDIIEVVKSLKSGKSDGNAGLFSDHLIHGTNKLYSYISILFNCMLIHCTSPHDMLVGTMVPIPKGKRANISLSDNYRGICLQSLFCKVLDIFMLKRDKDILCTSSAQFGFKEELSANIATSVVTETVDYFLGRGGNVYALALDATKAFDRVDFDKLFNVLMQRNFNPLYTRLLYNMYINQNVRVRYNATYSDYFNVTNGVKQGGVISPTLFTCYIDGMLESLKESQLGCHVGSEYIGCVSYADDLVLLAPNLTALRGMIKICEDYAIEYKIKFNGSKSQLLVFDKNTSKHPINMCVAGEPVEQVDSLKYLGHYLVNNRNDSHISPVKKDFIGKVNGFLGDFSSISSHIKFDLFNTYCMSLYGTNICDLDNKCMEPLYVEWRKALRKIWNIPYRTHSRLLYHIARTLPPDVIVKQRFVKFFYSGLMSKNPLVHFVFKNAKCNRSRMSNNLKYIFNNLSFNICTAECFNQNDICKSIVRKWWASCDEDDIRVGSQIREIIDEREAYDTFLLNESECQHLITFLCTAD